MSDLLRKAVNALTLSAELVELERRNLKPADAAVAGVNLLLLQLEHVLVDARRVAGLDPDTGEFRKVPKPKTPAPARKRGGS